MLPAFYNSTCSVSASSPIPLLTYKTGYLKTPGNSYFFTAQNPQDSLTSFALGLTGARMISSWSDSKVFSPIFCPNSLCSSQLAFLLPHSRFLFSSAGFGSGFCLCLECFSQTLPCGVFGDSFRPQARFPSLRDSFPHYFLAIPFIFFILMMMTYSYHVLLVLFLAYCLMHESAP